MTAALGFVRLVAPGPCPGEIRLLARWMDSWTGLGAVVVGMRAQGSDVELKEFPDGWRGRSIRSGSRIRSWKAPRSSRRRGAPCSTPRGWRSRLTTSAHDAGECGRFVREKGPAAPPGTARRRVRAAGEESRA